MATKIICDRCGKEIKDTPRYIVGCSNVKPSEKGEAPPSNWLWTAELCMGCALHIETAINSYKKGE